MKTIKSAVKHGAALAEAYGADATIYKFSERYYATVCPDYASDIMPSLEVIGKVWPNGTYVKYN